MAALDNAAAMDAPPQQQEDAFVAFRNAKHDPARREVSVVCVMFLPTEGEGGWGGRGAIASSSSQQGLRGLRIVKSKPSRPFVQV
jgi:hypothetical protein